MSTRTPSTRTFSDRLRSFGMIAFAVTTMVFGALRVVAQGVTETSDAAGPPQAQTPAAQSSPIPIPTAEDAPDNQR